MSIVAFLVSFSDYRGSREAPFVYVFGWSCRVVLSPLGVEVNGQQPAKTPDRWSVSPSEFVQIPRSLMLASFGARKSGL